MDLEIRKTKALEFMNNHQISESIILLKRITEEDYSFAAFYLCFCNFALQRYEAALYWANQYKLNGGMDKRINEVVNKIKTRVVWAQ
jgi:hypothetical protein